MTATSTPVAARAAKPAPRNARVWGALFLVVGGVLLALGGWSARLGLEAQSWPRAVATLADVKVSVVEDTSEARRDAFFQSRQDSLSVSVAFVYAFAGRDHVAGGIERGAFGLQSAALGRRLAGSIAKGGTVTVAVNPADPDEAYLAPGVSGLAWMLGGVGATVGLIGALMVAAERKAHRRARGRGGRL